MNYTLSTFAVKQEQVRPARRALAELVAAVREHEPRTLYLVFREEGSATFVTLMSFENEAAERRHAQSRYVSQFARKLLPMCEGKPRFIDLALYAGSKKHWVLDSDDLPPTSLAPPVAVPPRRANRPSRAKLASTALAV